MPTATPTTRLARLPGTSGTPAFPYHATPGLGLFYIHGSAYAPAMADLPAQYFFGEWTGDERGADIGIWEPASDTWRQIPLDGQQITSYLTADPTRPYVYMRGQKQLFAIDRRTLAVEPIAELPRKYTVDFDSQGNLWIAHERHLWRLNPDTRQLDHFPQVTDDRFYYPEGTHMVLGIAPDDSIWLSQGPNANISVFDSATGKAATLWSELDGDPTKLHNSKGFGTPFAIGNVMCIGDLHFDLATRKLLDDSPIPPGLQVYMALTWEHTPSNSVARNGCVPVMFDGRFGWLDPQTYAIDWVADLPAEIIGEGHRAHRAIHEGHTLIAADKNYIHSFDLRTQQLTSRRPAIDFEHAQAMFAWNVGPDNAIYASGYGHELLQVKPDGQLTNFGNIVNIMGGELWGFAFEGDKVWVISYTGSILTRVDLSRPADNWGREAANNPRHLIDLRNTGQHRPSAVEIAPDGRLYYISRSDYCKRREGALVIVDTKGETVQQVVDPLVPGEQLWGLACSQTRPEVYIGTGRGTFVVWDTDANAIKRTIKLPEHEGDGQTTSAGIYTGGVRFLAAAGDKVVGNQWGSMTYFTYDAATGEMTPSRPHAMGKVFGVYHWAVRDSFVLYINGNLYELDPRTDETALLYEGPLPGPYVRFGGEGQLFLADRLHVFAEADPAVNRLPATHA